MRPVLALGGLLATATASHAEEPLLYFVQADRLEYQEHVDAWLWDLQGWYGGDINRFWWKLEGERESGESAESELQLLYSRAISPYFDAQFGARYETEFEETSLVVGIQGLALYRFELDTALLLTENGDVLLSGEFERDLLFTQKLILQPRLEVNAAAQDIPERDISSGFTDAAVGVRLRYEIRREFAPYVGVSWQRNWGDGSRALRAAGEDDAFTTFVLGVRFWF